MTASLLARTARQRAGLTQAELAARVGLTQSVISAYEAGRREPSLPMLQRILGGAGARVDLIFPQAEITVPAHDDARSGAVFADLLTLIDALPPVERPAVLDAPRMVSRR